MLASVFGDGIPECDSQIDHDENPEAIIERRPPAHSSEWPETIPSHPRERGAWFGAGTLGVPRGDRKTEQRLHQAIRKVPASQRATRRVR